MERHQAPPHRLPNQTNKNPTRFTPVACGILLLRLHEHIQFPLRLLLPLFSIALAGECRYRFVCPRTPFYLP